MERFIGIDLGTTYSSVATIDEYGKPVIVKNHNGESLTPSVIFFDELGNSVVGSEAKELLQSGEENVAMFFKRFMGDDVFRFYAHDREYTAKDLSAILLRKLKDDAEEALGGEIRNVVITVPAYFNDLQRSETVFAGVEAGFNVLRIINEPTAAAITYGMSRSNNQRLLVYDLGGGTFDVTVLQITPDTIEVLATGGDHELGGKDWDDMLINHIVEQFRTEFGADPTESVEVYNDLAYDCEKLKKQLSSKESATISVRYNGMRGRYTITREKFEELTEAQLRSTKTMTEHVLEEAGLTWTDLDGALLVGGSTRMPMVENWVRQMSGKEPLRGVNVDEAVSLGAAIQAAAEMQKKESFRLGGNTTSNQQFRLVGSKKIVDVMSHSLGAVAVSKDGEKYVNSIIIQKNKAIPVTERKDFLHHTKKGQDNDLEVYLTQGESTEIKDCIVVGKYIFHGIDHTSNGDTIINIEYSYDENGLIVVNGTQQETKKQLIIEKVPIGDDMQWLYEKPFDKPVPYSEYAGQSHIPGVQTDQYGNPQGSQFDLAKDGAFNGYKVVITDLYGGLTNFMHSACHALQKKGFSVVSFNNFPLRKLKNVLEGNRTQLWILSDQKPHLSKDCCEFVYDYFNNGGGLYIWSDNDPLFVDSNIILSDLFHSEMSGDYVGDQVLSIQTEDGSPGIIKDHLITTGVQNLYEGVTISNVKISGGLQPLVYSSDGLVVTAYYDIDGKRCLVDGGYTRLYYKWDSAGTDRFVVNCAAWLANIERHGYHPDKIGEGLIGGIINRFKKPLS